MQLPIDRALDAGFTKACPLNCSTLIFRTEVRDMCSANLCGKYGRYWVCPPACGTLEECAKKASRYSRGILVALVGATDDPFDIEGMLAAGRRHRELFAQLALDLKRDWPRLLALSAGDCVFCQTCTYPDSPCRFPDLAAPSMEAFGLLVSEICEANQLPYTHGANTVTYIGCYLLE